MSDILQIFTGNPLTTFVGKKIEAATRPELESDDWALNMEICDIINENDDDAKDAARAIKKRLQQIEHDRNFTITNRTLTVLETCVSNCSHRFHVLVMTKDFIQDLVKLIGPKNNPPVDLQERVLSLIERWAEAFRSQPDLNGVWSVYQDLKAKGLTFPQRDPSSSVPIQTPQRTLPPSQAPRQTSDRASVRIMDQQQPFAQVILEGEGYNKISQDLTVVQSSIEMLTDITGILESPSCESSDWDLAADLNATCRQMKERIVELIERVANEDLTIELLRLNDELNIAFTKYDRLVKNKTKSPSSVAPTGRPSSVDTPKQASNEDVQGVHSNAETARTEGPKLPGVSSRTLNDLSLIDFNAMSPADKAAVNREEKLPETKQKQPSGYTNDPFDTSNILANRSEGLSNELSRLDLGPGKSSAGEQVSKPDTKTKTPLPDEISSVREQDFVEIENWLATDSGRSAGDPTSLEPISVPNSEFENFIASRALAGSGDGSDVRIPTSNRPPRNAQPEPSS